ncbi:putative propanediol utilization polyhedral bodies protein [Yersinia massiliensis]|uniref:BMC domain-containing protein n=1 Tax=Yersinia massiliensis TaxID=419257 RepID=UPI0005E64710|nr:BMC domain-containing protein [Yersinia massiliensis]CNI42067.1 putative propanediol utilization polyhedral bodies protein [Yersinia massiliensis]
MKTSLGLLEVSGLALAIGAADAMAKAASVNLIGIEKTNGSGWMLIRLTGDVASVQAAISTGVAFAEQHHGLVSRAVLARPADSLMAYWQAPNEAITVEVQATLDPVNEPVSEGVSELAVEVVEEVKAEAEAPAIDEAQTEEIDAPKPAETATDDAPDTVVSIEKKRIESEALQAPRVSCNLCLDPACRRHKGEPRFRCIHLGKRGKV